MWACGYVPRTYKRLPRFSSSSVTPFGFSVAALAYRGHVITSPEQQNRKKKCAWTKKRCLRESSPRTFLVRWKKLAVGLQLYISADKVAPMGNAF